VRQHQGIHFLQVKVEGLLWPEDHSSLVCLSGLHGCLWASLLIRYAHSLSVLGPFSSSGLASRTFELALFPARGGQSIRVVAQGLSRDWLRHHEPHLRLVLTIRSTPTPAQLPQSTQSFVVLRSLSRSHSWLFASSGRSDPPGLSSVSSTSPLEPPRSRSPLGVGLLLTRRNFSPRSYSCSIEGMSTSPDLSYHCC